MYNQELESLIDAALADGVLTEKEKQILFRKAQSMGIDLDEFEMVLDARLVNLKKTEKENVSTSAPKSNKLGDVNKCPACGAIVQNFQAVCPECGYAFENIDANNSTKRFSELLDKIMLENSQIYKEKTSNESRQKFSFSEMQDRAKVDLEKYNRITNAIKNFPVPSTKSDLFEFITSLQSKIEGEYGNAYKSKLEECILKARTLFPNDKMFAELVNNYEKEKSKKKKKLIYIIGAIALLFLLLILFMPGETKYNLEDCTTAINKALKDNNTQKAINIFLEFEGRGKHKGKWQLAENGTTQSIIDACLADGNLEDAIRVGNAVEMKYDHFTDYKAKMASTIYEYCISHGDFETAKRIYQTADCDFYFHGKYIMDVVTYLCKNGQKDEAQRFLISNKGIIDDRNDKLGEPKEVVKMIQEIIDSY